MTTVSTPIVDYRTSPATGVLAFVAAFLESLETTPATGYLPVKRANWEKKIRQGKVPFDEVRARALDLGRRIRSRRVILRDDAADGGEDLLHRRFLRALVGHVLGRR